MFRFFILVIPFILAACNTQEDELKKIAISSIKEQLRDPDSAKFSGVFLPKGDKGNVSVCGNVNAKNSFGGYAGTVRFLVYIYNNQENGKSIVHLSKLEASTPTISSDITSQTVFDSAWKVFCTSEKAT